MSVESRISTLPLPTNLYFEVTNSKGSGRGSGAASRVLAAGRAK
jgi:hypothetical protein